MSNLVPFSFGSKEIRITDQNGDTWFVLRDLLDAMESATKVTDAVESLKQGLGDGFVNDVPILDSLGRKQTAIIVAEPAATFLLARSNTDKGRALNRFIHVEILPSIRKTGGYAVAINPANLSRLQLIELAMQAEQERLVLEEKVAVIQPKADALDRIATASDGAMCPTNAAKALQKRRSDLIAWMLVHQWVYRRAGNKNLIAYQDKIHQGLLEHKVHVSRDEHGVERVHENVLITPKGLAKLARIFQVQVQPALVLEGEAA